MKQFDVYCRGERSKRDDLTQVSSNQETLRQYEVPAQFRFYSILEKNLLFREREGPDLQDTFQYNNNTLYWYSYVADRFDSISWTVVFFLWI